MVDAERGHSDVIAETEVQTQLGSNVPGIIEICGIFRHAEPETAVPASQRGALVHIVHKTRFKLGEGIPAGTVGAEPSGGIASTGARVVISADIQRADHVVIPLVASLPVEAKLEGMAPDGFC